MLKFKLQNFKKISLNLEFETPWVTSRRSLKFNASPDILNFKKTWGIFILFENFDEFWKYSCERRCKNVNAIFWNRWFFSLKLSETYEKFLKTLRTIWSLPKPLIFVDSSCKVYEMFVKLLGNLSATAIVVA